MLSFIPLLAWPFSKSCQFYFNDFQNYVIQVRLFFQVFEYTF